MGTNSNPEASNSANLYKLQEDDLWRVGDVADDECSRCGRKLRQGVFFVEAVAGGTHLSIPGKANPSDSGYMGAWLIGSECARRFPREFVSKLEQ